MASDLASALLSGDSAGLSANPALAELLPRMRLAQALQSEGVSTAPAHPVQAAARLFQALVGGQMAGDTSTKLRDIFEGNQQQYRDFANTLPGLGGGVAPQPTPSAAPKSSLAATIAGSSTPPSVLGAGGKPVLPDAQGVYGSDAVMMPPTGQPDYGKAIAGIETGGQKNPYATVGPANGKGQRPIGKYQVMDFNVGPWTQEILGKAMSPQEFAASPEAQEAVFKGKFVDQYLKQTGNPQDAASMWFTGKPLAQGAGRQDTLGTTGQAYVDKFNANLGQQPQTAQAGSDGPAMAFSGAPAPAGGAGLPAPITGQPAPQAAPQAATAAQGGAPQPGYTVSPQIAAMIKNGLASPNPAIRDFAMKTYQQVLAHQMAPPELKTMKNILGVDVPYWSNPNAQTLTPAQPGSRSESAGGGAPEDILAAAEKEMPGVSNRVAQLYRGEGGFPNARTNKIDAVAMNVIQQIHPDWNAELFKQKNTMRNDLAKSSAGTIGGILSNGKSAFEHLANLSGSLAGLGNVSGPDVPGGAHVGAVGNFIGNVAIPTPETKGKIAGANANALKYGQESTKFYAGTGGGEAERMNALRAMDPRSTLATEQAGFLEAEKELMLGRLRQKEAQVRSVLGDDYLEKKPIMDNELQGFIKKIDDNIAKLRGTAPAATSSAPAGGAPATAPTAPQTKSIGGKTYYKQDGQWFEQ
jgi:hypothetical protein